MGELKLYGMKAAFYEITATAVSPRPLPRAPLSSPEGLRCAHGSLRGLLHQATEGSLWGAYRVPFQRRLTDVVNCGAGRRAESFAQSSGKSCRTLAQHSVQAIFRMVRLAQLLHKPNNWIN